MADRGDINEGDLLYVEVDGAEFEVWVGYYHPYIQECWEHEGHAEVIEVSAMGLDLEEEGTDITVGSHAENSWQQKLINKIYARDFTTP